MSVESRASGSAPSRSGRDFEYRGRWGLVTGASAGIGAEFARALALRGMNLVLTARRHDRLEALAREMQARHGIAAVAVEGDLSTRGEAERVWREAVNGREIHLLVNNAGFGAKGEFPTLRRERQVEMVEVNCTALLELMHLALVPMRERREGAVLNVASVAAFQPIPDLATYAATKAFVLSLSEAVAEEVRSYGVRVTALNPGPVRTEFQGVAGTSLSRSTPGVLSAGSVVEAALAGLEAGRRSVVPGALNRAGTIAARHLPRSWVVRAAKAVLRSLR